MRRRAPRFALAATIAWLVACAESRSPAPNRPPVAVARVVLASGPADETTLPKMQDALSFAFDGAALEVQLDATASSDEDGEIAEYLWQSAGPVASDGTPLPTPSAARFASPERNEHGWSADVAEPVVRIAEPGVYIFNLWVTDDAGAMSEPDAIRFRFGDGHDEATATCMSNVAASVPARCARCLCGVSEMCMQSVAETQCDEHCWSFIRCLTDKCPNFRMMAGVMDFSCVTTNCNAEFAAAGTGFGPVGPCIAMCPEECREL